MKTLSAKPRVVCLVDSHGPMLPTACAYIRLILPLTAPYVSGLFDVRFARPDAIAIHRPDIVIAQRLQANSDTEIDKLLETCRRANARLVYEIDDDLQHIDRDHPEFDFYQRAGQGVRRLASVADEVWVSTENLAIAFRSLNANVVVLQNTLDPRLWKQVEAAKAVSTPRIVYMGSTTHSNDYSTVFLPAIERLRREAKDRIDVSLIGVMDRTSVQQQSRVVAIPHGVGASYPSFVSWLQSLERFDIGVAPLVNTPFNTSKSHIKWLEYGGMGAVTVASAVGEYAASIIHRKTGLIAGSTAADFYETLREVVFDSDLRESLALGVRSHIREHLEDVRRDTRRAGRLAGLVGSATLQRA